MAWHPTKLKEALLPIFIPNWLAGLDVAEYPIGKPRHNFSTIQLMIIISGYFYMSFIRGYTTCTIDAIPTTASYLILSIWIFTIITAIFSLFVSRYYEKILKMCIRRMEIIDETLECLGCYHNWMKIFKTGLISSLISFLGMFLTFVVDFLWFYIRRDVTQGLYCTYRFQAPIMVITAVDLTFTNLIRSIGFSLENINFLLQKANRNNVKFENYKLHQKLHRTIFFISFSDYNSEIKENIINLVQLLKHVHLELLDVAWELNKIYGMQVAMTVTANTILIIIHAYYLSGTFSHSDSFDYEAILTIISCTLWCTGRFAIIVYMNHICGQVALEAQKTNELLFELKILIEDAQLTEEIDQFSFQIRQRPLNFSTYGLFLLEHKIIVKVLGITITYLTYLMQISPRKRIPQENIS